MPFSKSFRSRQVFTFFLLERSISCGLTFKDCDSSCFILTRFLTTFLRATSFKIWTLSAFLNISETTRTNWNFNFKTNLSYEPVKNPRYNIHCFEVMLIFSKLMRTIHISMTSTFQSEYCQCFTFKRCDKFKLNCCTSHGGIYSAHYFGKISVRSRPCML